MIRRSAACLIGLALLVPGQVLALGLGEIEQKSALNQPFLAEIELLSPTDEDLQSLRVLLASADTFDRYGLARPIMLTDLQFEVVGTGEGAVVRITTRNPVREPFMTFLVQAEWSSGRLLREYTVLLDPPTFVDDEPSTAAVVAPLQAPVATTTPATQPSPEPAATATSIETTSAATPEPLVSQPEPAVEAPRQRPPRQRPPITRRGAPGPSSYTPAATHRGDSYGPVQRNETLWRIAQATRPDQSVTINQMMIALFNANPEAFEGNINRLQAGYVLRVPALDEIRAITRDRAFAEVRQHNEAWRAGVSTSAVAASGQRDPQLRLVAPDGATAAGTGTVDDAALADLQSELDATRRALAAAESDAAALDGQVSELAQDVTEAERLLSVKDSQIADLQTRLREAGEDADVTPVEPFEQFDDTADVSDDAMADDAMADDVEVVDFGAGTDDDAMVDDGMADADAMAETDDATTEAMADAADEVAADDDVAAADDAAADPAPTGAQPASGVQPPPSLFDPLLDNIIYVIGGVLVLVLGVVIVITLRRRKASDGPSLGVTGEASAWDDEADTPTEVAGATEGGVSGLVQEDDEEEDDEASEKTQRISQDEMNSTLIQGPEDMPQAEAEAPADEPPLDATMAAAPINLDDGGAIAEADFNMAYGLYDQAADGLKKALEGDPGRRDLTLKLLEVYFVWGNTEEFVNVARVLSDEIGGAADADWDKVVIMGKQICPDEELFSGEVGVGATDADVDLGFGDDSGSQETSSDLDIFGDMGGDAPADSAAETGGSEVPEATAVVDLPGDDGAEHSLGIDLDDLGLGGDTGVVDGGGDEPVAASDDLPEATSYDDGEPTMAAGDADSLEFDMDLTSEDAEETDDATQIQSPEELESALDEAAAAAPEAPAAEDSLSEDSLDLGLDFDASLGGDDAADAPTSEAAAEEPLDIDADLVSDLGADEAPVAEPEAADPAAEDGPSLTDSQMFESAMDDLSSFVDTNNPEDAGGGDGADSIFGDDGETTGADDSILDASADTDLGSLVDDDSAAGAEFDLDADGAGEEAPSTGGGDSSEVGTKLDLARAYIDMGDPDGAKALLQEVMDEGDDAQKAEAESLMGSLG